MKRDLILVTGGFAIANWLVASVVRPSPLPIFMLACMVTLVAYVLFSKLVP